MRIIVVLLFIQLIISSGCNSAVDWPKQWGTEKTDISQTILMDNFGDIIVVGRSLGWFEDQGEWINTGLESANSVFFTKFSTTGEKIWTKQWFNEGVGDVVSASLDKNGNIFVVGQAREPISGSQILGESDVFLAKFNSEGEQIWAKQWGSEKGDYPISVLINKLGDVFVIGDSWGDMGDDLNVENTGRMFMAKFQNDGEKLWIKQFGYYPDDSCYSSYIDSDGSIFITGYSYYDIENDDYSGTERTFLSKFDENGESLWYKQLGQKDDHGKTITVDYSGNIYVFWGNSNIDTTNYLNFLSKLDSSGNELWTKSVKEKLLSLSSGYTIPSGVQLVNSFDDSLFVIGSISSESRDKEIAVLKFSGDGEESWEKKFGTKGEDRVTSALMDSSEALLILGRTDGVFNNCSSSGSTDSFLIRLEPEELK